jgi:mannose-6-phosphate isomerase-like protein (cupin superfamily)
MPGVGDTYELHDHERVAVTALTPELLEVEAEWGAAEHRPLAHVHAAQDERFVVHEGELTIDAGGQRRTLRAGDTADVARGTPHRMWNSGETPARATWQIRPALRTADFWTAVDAARRTRPTDAHGMLTPVAAAPLLHEYRTEFALALPAPVRAVATTTLRIAARLRGY